MYFTRTYTYDLRRCQGERVQKRFLLRGTVNRPPAPPAPRNEIQRRRTVDAVRGRAAAHYSMSRFFES
jgi:hypothetical protein